MVKLLLHYLQIVNKQAVTGNLQSLIGGYLYSNKNCAKNLRVENFLN